MTQFVLVWLSTYIDQAFLFLQSNFAGSWHTVHANCSSHNCDNEADMIPTEIFVLEPVSQCANGSQMWPEWYQIALATKDEALNISCKFTASFSVEFAVLKDLSAQGSQSIWAVHVDMCYNSPLQNLSFKTILLQSINTLWCLCSQAFMISRNQVSELFVVHCTRTINICMLNVGLAPESTTWTTVSHSSSYSFTINFVIVINRFDLRSTWKSKLSVWSELYMWHGHKYLQVYHWVKCGGRTK